MINKIDESQYKVDFTISEKFIDFSSELLRISLLIIGGLGTFFIKDNQNMNTLRANPCPFIISLLFFVICVGAALCHRYCATDALSWYVSWLRAEQSQDITRAKKEKKGFYFLLKLSKFSLITCELSFALGTITFLVAIIKLLC